MNRRYLATTAAPLIGVAILSLAVGSTGAPSNALAVDRGDRVPEIGLQDLEGRRVSVGDFRGKVLIVDFWATWCAPCRQELPFLERLRSRYEDQGLAIVGVSVDEERGNIRRFLRQSGVRFRVVHDGDKTVAERYGLDRMPTNYVVDRRGVVRYVNPTFRAEHAERIENQVKRLLAAR